MNDKKKVIDIQKARKELHAGKKHVAAAISLESGKRRISNSHPGKRLFNFRVSMVGIIFFLIIGVGTVSYIKLFAGNSNNINSTTIVEQVQELSNLITADAVVTTVIKEEDNKLFDQKINLNLPGTKRTALIIVPADVLAGVDLKSLTDKDIQLDEKKKEITLTIPHAKIIQEPVIKMDKIQTYSEEGIFRNDVNWDEGFNLAGEADDKLKKEAIDMGLLTKADDSAKKALVHFFKLMGYKTHIIFK